MNNQENDLVEQMEQMNVNSVESISAWDAIYQYMYPQLKRDYDRNDLMYNMFSTEESVLEPQEQLREIEKYRNEISRIIQVRAVLRRFAGYRH